MSTNYPNVLKPIKIGSMTVKNRINMAPMTTLFAGSDGEVTDQLMQYYAARARGGAGMVTIEGAYINETGLQIPCSINVSDDKFVPGLSRIANAIKDNGSCAVLQLIHSGVQAWVEQSVGPSEIGRIDGKPISTELTPRALTAKEVHQYVKDFGQAARRAKMAGFDAVQVHGTHGYLIMQFLSPVTNHRIDNYGVDRNLFPVEIIQEIKRVCGPDFPVIFRLCADETLGDKLHPQGITLEDSKETARRLEAAGVDAFDVTGGSDDVIHLYVPSAYILPDALKQFGKEHPEVYFSIHQSDSAGTERGVLEGLFDLGLTGRSPESETLEAEPFCSDEMVLITPVSRYYLEMKERHASVRELLDQPIILREEGSGSLKAADRYLAGEKIDQSSLHVVARINDQEAIKNMVAGGVGISFLSSRAAMEFVEAKRVLSFHLPPGTAVRQFYILQRKGDIPSPLRKEFIRFLKNHSELL